jgi:hypothetical protein
LEGCCNPSAILIQQLINHQAGKMPLNDNAKNLILKNLLKIHRGRNAWPVLVGRLTDTQLAALNEERRGRGFPPMSAQVVFIGNHIYDSRVTEDGYTFDDVIAQIESAMDEAAVFREGPKMGGLVSPKKRDDGYGNQVTDEAVLECSTKFPRAELYSVIPKGDHNKPQKNNTDRESAACVNTSADSTG